MDAKKLKSLFGIDSKVQNDATRYLIASLKQGEKAVWKGRVYSHSDAKKKMKKWL